MIGHLLLFAKEDGVLIENWTPEIVVELVRSYCENTPEEAELFEVLPETLATFFQFLATKNHLPNGNEIANAIISIKKEIHQTEEERNRLEIMHGLIQEARDAGIDVREKGAIKAFFNQKLQEKKVINEFQAKLNNGIPIPKIMANLSKAELDIVMNLSLIHI